MILFYIKALHIIFVVTWFAGLFYIVRLFVYFQETEERPQAEAVVLREQFKIMQRRLWYGITWPSMLLTLISGTWLVLGFHMWTQPWMLVKIGFVVGLTIYHFLCGSILRQCQKDELSVSSTQLRIWNEVATIFLVAIVFLVVLKNTVDFLWGLVGLVVFTAVLMFAIKIYKTLRLKKDLPTSAEE